MDTIVTIDDPGCGDGGRYRTVRLQQGADHGYSRKFPARWLDPTCRVWETKKYQDIVYAQVYGAVQNTGDDACSFPPVDKEAHNLSSVPQNVLRIGKETDSAHKPCLGTISLSEIEVPRYPAIVESRRIVDHPGVADPDDSYSNVRVPRLSQGHLIISPGWQITLGSYLKMNLPFEDIYPKVTGDHHDSPNPVTRAVYKRFLYHEFGLIDEKAGHAVVNTKSNRNRRILLKALAKGDA